LGADRAYLPWVDPRHYPYPPRRTDADGRIELPDLIPGALYRISDRTTVNDPKRMQIRKDFTVKPGETVDLGDILVEYPKEGRN
jgi:hypothetical protein